jgi:hypothetical protein
MDGSFSIENLCCVKKIPRGARVELTRGTVKERKISIIKSRVSIRQSELRARRQVRALSDTYLHAAGTGQVRHLRIAHLTAAPPSRGRLMSLHWQARGARIFIRCHQTRRHTANPVSFRDTRNRFLYSTCVYSVQYVPQIKHKALVPNELC